MQPRIWKRCSFADWVKLCDMMDSWDENLQEMPYCDWTIHRKLGEEAGLAHRYIIPARGSGKSMFIDSFDDPEKIFRKHREDHKPQEFVTIKDGDVERWLREAEEREWVERLHETIMNRDTREIMKKRITTYNPYWDFDPIVRVDSLGNIVFRDTWPPGFRYLLNEEEEG